MRDMRVAHLTSVHGAMDVRIWHKECQTLAAHGFDVVLGAQEAARGETGGPRGVGVGPARDRGDRATRVAWRLVRMARRERAVLCHLHDPELLPWGVLLKFGGAKVVYDAHEDLPRQVLSKPWLPPWSRRLVAFGAGMVEALAARCLDGVVAATPAIARRFPGATVVQNFPELGELLCSHPTPYAQRPPVVAYVGGVSRIRGALEMVQSMELLPTALGAELHVAGEFAPETLMEDLAALPGWERIRWLGWCARPEVAALLGRARIGMVVLSPLRNYVESQPTKLFEYMGAGIPVVASDFPAWRGFVEGPRCGLLVDPLDPRAIARAVEWLLTHPSEAQEMGRRGRQAVLERWNWESEGRALLGLYARLGVLPGRPTEHETATVESGIVSAR